MIKPIKMSKQMRTMHKAVHEAGHAVIAHVLGYVLSSVEITDGNAATRYFKSAMAKPEKEMMMCFAGTEAELALLGRVGDGYGQDLDDMLELLTELPRARHMRKFDQIKRKTAKLVMAYREEIMVVAFALVQKRKLTGKQVWRIVREHIDLYGA